MSGLMIEWSGLSLVEWTGCLYLVWKVADSTPGLAGADMPLRVARIGSLSPVCPL